MTRGVQLLVCVAILAAPAMGQEATEADLAFDRVIAQEADLDRLADASVRWRSERAVANGARRGDVDLVAENAPAFAEKLALLLDLRRDDAGKAYALAARIVNERTKAALDFPDLCAALCVVRDRPLSQRVNENRATAPDPLDVLDYFVERARSLAFPIRDMPAELLVHVVDVVAPIEELRWAADRYKGDVRVGNRYQEITYDTAHLRRRTTKKITTEGFTLPNIRKYGGVCVDQAYFACQVGKALGIPTVFVVAEGDESGHAYLGYVEVRGTKAAWNFDAGRYDSYEKVIGLVEDPQTGEQMTTARIGLRCEISESGRKARRHAAGLSTASERLLRIYVDGEPWPPQGVTAPALRDASPAGQTALLRQALALAPGHAPAWEGVMSIVAAPELDARDRIAWAESTVEWCGDRFPEFAVEVALRIMAGEGEPSVRESAFGRLAKAMNAHPELAARLRIEQARAAAMEGRRAQAWDILQSIIRKHAQDGPFVIDAIAQADALLADGGRPAQERIDLWADAWRRTRKPSGQAVEFTRGSTWYLVGDAYAKCLTAAGKTEEAAEVREKLNG